MGSWSFLSSRARFTKLDDAYNYGTNFYAQFRIKYTPSTFGKFVEPPHLAWDEVIMFNDYKDSEQWQFTGNMYTHKPASPTVGVWAQRYFRAYCDIHNTPHPDQYMWKGSSKLFDKHNVPVTRTAIGTHMGVDAQNKAVQDYLKRHGGILEIEIHDIPSFVKATAGQTFNQERVLIFNVGVTGLGGRIQAWQHLKMDTTQPATTWINNFQVNGNAPGLRTSGLKVVQNFAVSLPNTAMPTGGIL
jgi:hypothetical protein